MNPGSLNVRLGNVLQLIETAVDTGKLATMANLVDLVATYLSVHLNPKEMQKYEAMPGFTYGDERTPGQVFGSLNGRLRYLLGIAKQHGVFARQDVEAGDASGLDREEEEE